MGNSGSNEDNSLKENMPILQRLDIVGVFNVTKCLTFRQDIWGWLLWTLRDMYGDMTWGYEGI